MNGLSIHREGLALPLLLIAGACLAQQADVDRCRQAPSDAERIACLEAALLARDTEATAASSEATAVKSPPPPPAAPVVTGIGAEQVAVKEPDAEESRAEPDSVTGLRVAAYDTVHYQRLRITLENGQVWQQIQGDTQNIRVDVERNPTVDISRSFLGGYKLRLNEMGRTIRVQRLQ